MMKRFGALPKWLSRALLILLGGVAFAVPLVACQLLGSVLEGAIAMAHGWIFPASAAGVPALAPQPLPPWQWLRALGSVVCFGILLAACFVFGDDDKVGRTASRQRLARTLIGCAAGAAVALIWQWPAWGGAACGLLFAVLGWYGRAWADHVDVV